MDRSEIRARAAIAAMGGYLAAKVPGYEDADWLALASVDQADRLLAELDRTAPKCEHGNKVPGVVSGYCGVCGESY